MIQNAYHKALRWAEDAYNEEKALTLVNEALENGMQALYKHMRSKGNSAYIDPAIFVKHVEDLFVKDVEIMKPSKPVKEMVMNF